MFSDEIQVIPDGRTSLNADVGTYPDGMPVVKSDRYRDLKTGTAVDVVLRPTTLESFVTGLFTVDALNERGNRVSRLILPFIPAARQDRINPAGDFLFTLKSVAKMINERNFDEVVVFDPHSNVATALIDRVKVFPFTEVLDGTWAHFDAIIAPDAGAGHRAQEASDALYENSDHERRIPVIQATKTRDIETGRLSGFDVDVKKGKNYLVFDDICDGGGTFIGLGEKIKEQGATAGLFVSHGVFSKGTSEINKIYNTVTTTDSTLFDKHDARVIRVVGRMINS